MGTEDRQQDDAVKAAVCTNSHEFDFFRLMALLEAREGVPLGSNTSARREHFRLYQEISLNFPPSAVASASYQSERDRITVIIRCLGLLGPSGALPGVWSEDIMRRVRSKRDKTLYHFINSFQHRFFTLFYRAWALNQRCVDYTWGEQGKHRSHQGALVALHGDERPKAGKLEPNTRLYYAGTFGGYTANRSALRDFLEDYFEVPFELHEFVGDWLEIPPPERACLGQRADTTTLGSNSVIGERIWNAHLKFRIHIGPVGHDDFLRFLPNHESFHKLRDAVNNYVGEHYECALSMTLRAPEVPQVVLGRKSFLGWNTWLGKRHSKQHADNYLVNLNHYPFEHYGRN